MVEPDERLQFGIWCLPGIISTLNEISPSTHYKPKFSPLIDLGV